MKNDFGNILRKWRKLRRYSQLQLAVELAISSKHISFIETGRAMASREMIVNIGNFLSLPKLEINRALSTAGFSPVYNDLSYQHEDLKYVYRAIDTMLENHMPYPALVLNKYWDVVKTNDSAKNLMVILGFARHTNLIEAIIDDNPEQSKIINWQETALGVLARLRHEISLLGGPKIGGSKRLELLEQKLSLCLQENEGINFDVKQPVLSIKVTEYDTEISFFSIISQLSTVQDVTVSEFKVELMFPVGKATEKFYCSVPSFKTVS